MNSAPHFRRVPSIVALATLALWGCTETPGEKTTAPRVGGPLFAPGSNPGANLDQWATGKTPPTGEEWQNGNLNGNNSAYAEGRAVPFRLAIEGLTAGSHFITIQYDFTAGGHKAYDFLASIDATEPNALAKICEGGGGGRSSLCGSSNAGMPGSVTPNPFPFPGDGFDPDGNGKTVNQAMADAALPRQLIIFGGTITAISTVTHAGPTGGNSTGQMLVEFTTTGSAALLVWSGHLGKSVFWNGPTDPDGAGQVSGAPWHMRTLNLDAGGAANQDRSIQPSALVVADANIQISASGVNEVGTWHPMTGHVNINAGAGFVNAPDGTVITFAIASGPGIIVGTSGSTTPLGPPATCTTSGGTGSCTVFLYSTTAGLTTVNASTTVTVNTTQVSRSTDGVAPNSGPLTKQWVDAQIDLSPLTAINSLGQEHTVTATVQQDDGLPSGAPGDNATGFGPAAGKLVTFSLLNNTAGASFKNGTSTCTTDAAGQCSIILLSTQAGGVDIHATSTFSVGGVSLTRATGTGGLNSADAHKDWQSGSIAWTKVKGDGTTKLGGAVFEYRLQGAATWIEVTDDVDGPPTPGVDQDGDPGEFLITGLAAGTYEVREKTPPPGYNKDPDTETVTLGPAPADLNKSITTAFVDPAPRAKIVLSPLTATNEVNSAHTITATVSQDDGLAAGLGGDNTDGYVASPGRTVNFSLLNNTAGASFVGGVSSCVTNGSGQCSVQINTTTAGSVDIHATTTFTIGIVDLTATTNTGGDNSADANKVYVDAQIDLSPLTATNVVGETHTVTATVQQDDGRPAGAPGDGVTGFGPAVGVTVNFSLLNNTAGASFVGGVNSCVTNGAGQCSITIEATQAGGVDIHATTTFSVGGVSLTRATGTGGLNSADAHKDYITGSLAWFKNDNNGQRLGGATFQYRLSPAGPWISVTDNSAPDADPDPGEFLIQGLAIGTYDVQETAAPPGYTPDASIKQGTITHEAPNAVIAVAFVNTPILGKGCTPGFWKNKTDAWDSPSDPLAIATGFYTGTLFNTYFGLTEQQSPLSNSGTMLDAIGLGGGGAQKLARHGVAALLNVAALGGQYQLPAGITTLAQLKAALTAAFISGNYEPLASQLAASNDNDHSLCPQ